MSQPRLLAEEECIQLIKEGGVGRVAVTTHDGPEIFPVNFVLDGQTIVFRTSPYSVLGTYGWASPIAFEADAIFPERHEGWSVVAVGRAGVISDPDEVAALRERGPEPWAAGARPLYIRLAWSRISGRALGAVG